MSWFEKRKRKKESWFLTQDMLPCTELKEMSKRCKPRLRILIFYFHLLDSFFRRT